MLESQNADGVALMSRFQRIKQLSISYDWIWKASEQIVCYKDRKEYRIERNFGNESFKRNGSFYHSSLLADKQCENYLDLSYKLKHYTVKSHVHIYFLRFNVRASSVSTSDINDRTFKFCNFWQKYSTKISERGHRFKISRDT